MSKYEQYCEANGICIYCHNYEDIPPEKSDDFVHEMRHVLSGELSLGDIGFHEFDLTIERDRLYLNFMYGNGEYNYFEKTFLSKKIKYCPMCGRRLGLEP